MTHSQTEMKQLSKAVSKAIIAVCAGFMMIGCTLNPVSITDRILNTEDIKLGVELYNINYQYFNEEQLQQVNTGIAERMDVMVDEWDGQEDSAQDLIDNLNAVTEIMNDDLSVQASEYIAYVQCEAAGNALLEQAEYSYGLENYLGAMKCCLQADSDYSQYDRLEIVYNDSKLCLLYDLGNPETDDEYSTALGKLNSYLNAVDDADFRTAYDRLNQEYQSFRYVRDCLTAAADLYENGDYDGAFAKLSTGRTYTHGDAKIEYALNSFQYDYILKVTAETVNLVEAGEDKAALAMVQDAIEICECDEFRELEHELRKKTDVFYLIQSTAADTGDYIYRSGRKLVMGDFAEDEQHTFLSLGGNIAMSVANVDAPLDIRDLAYDIVNWGEGDYFYARLALDALGILPVIGALKYLAKADDIHDTVKAADNIADAARAADTADDIHDALKAADNMADAADALDTVTDSAGVLSDVRRIASTSADLTDDFHDLVKQTDVIDDVADSIKDTANVSDTVSDAGKTAVRHYDSIVTINQRYEGTIDPASGIPFVRKNLDYSDGRHISGVFPQFESKFDVNLPEEYIHVSFARQKTYLNRSLKEYAETAEGLKELQKTFSDDAIAQILDGSIPDGYIWHHNEVEGLMQLVDAEKHALTGHSGGMSLWGIGY